MIDRNLMDHIVKLHFEQGRTYRSLAEEFGVSGGAIARAVKRLRKAAEADECQARALADLEEMHRLRQEVEELKKENDFLKKAAAFFAKENH